LKHIREAITQAHHEQWARVVAALTRRFGDLDIAEEAAAEAFATAVQRWPDDGVPPNPGAWLTTTANRKAIDRIPENKRDDKEKEAQMWYDDDPPEPCGARPRWNRVSTPTSTTPSGPPARRYAFKIRTGRCQGELRVTRGDSYPDPVNSCVSTTVLIGRGVMIGSAWRCAILQVSPSRRRIMVVRSAIGLMSSLPANRAWARSIWTM
jgi:hypothetical protein